MNGQFGDRWIGKHWEALPEEVAIHIALSRAKDDLIRSGILSTADDILILANAHLQSVKRSGYLANVDDIFPQKKAA